MDQSRFKHVENEYFRLKGLLAAGRLNRQQFEEALKPLVVQDEQGRYWMLGVDDAKWYVHDGKSWVQRDPAGSPTFSLPATSAPTALPRPKSRIPILVIGGGIVLLCLCGIVGILFAMNQGWVRVNPARPPTVFLLPTPYIFPSPYVAPLPTNPPMSTAAVLPTFAPKTTLMPAPTLASIPTLVPVATLAPTAPLTPTLAATPSPTLRPQGNCADPNARWENVVDGQTIEPYQAFIGTATAPDFAGYVVEWIRPGNVLHRSTTPVTHGVIFVWNTYTVENGVYPVALTVVLQDGTTLASCVVTVRVAR
ncbi:MAG: hypothetical protein AB1817_03835 [Chloroflexota bacterium]